jgi:hypothetical protein
MKKSLLLVSALLLASSQAQDGAAQIFERAKAAHGGAALETMTTYRDAGAINVFNEKGEIAGKIDYKQIYNFANSTVRFEYFQDKKLVQILQTTPNQAWGWTEQSGVVRLPAAQAKPLRDSINQGLFAFRAKTADVKDLKALGNVKIGNGEGTLLNFNVAGILNAPIIAADGTVIGGQVNINGVLTESVSSDFRTVDGIKIAFVTNAFVNKQRAFETVVNNAEVNPTLSEADFAQPK